MAKLDRSKREMSPSVGRSHNTFSRLLLFPTTSVIVITILLVLPISSIIQLREWFSTTLTPYLPPHLRTQLLSTLKPDSTTTKATSSPASDPQDLLQACQTHQYSTEILSLDPLLIYITNFTSVLEAEQLITLGSADFTESFISRGSGTTHRVSGRTSDSAPLPLSHPLVSCILSRARRFMGTMLLPSEPFSIPQLVRYVAGQKFNLHTDFWAQHQVTAVDQEEVGRGAGKRDMFFNRVASFFVFLRDNCTGGYTYFPLINVPAQVDLEALFEGRVERGDVGGEEGGVKVKPVRGNALFWVNLDEEGKGDGRVVHAGLPVDEGEKIGLNIWPRKYFGYVDGGEEQKRTGWSGKWKD
ncbi:uncharacterized protein SETTUDRAFT_38254 [Exserohilum turcica Et28A]|uniref:Prolyl 4-hydroxylase alpha subunit domain-containing protein n=1 Tax=Exserohilum turcicum (strain 28A) TaxID=671987 RepID=R0KLX0_EXST2|nr:uncharacterized protein SETTUDRAFT_38254 [Exserohilum turcica Et28A]EOA88942.1 hypothetical protein SETTUDRAFT_38254 [Exserohilum turcica Et28A]